MNNSLLWLLMFYFLNWYLSYWSSKDRNILIFLEILKYLLFTFLFQWNFFPKAIINNLINSAESIWSLLQLRKLTMHYITWSIADAWQITFLPILTYRVYFKRFSLFFICVLLHDVSCYQALSLTRLKLVKRMFQQKNIAISIFLYYFTWVNDHYCCL